MSRTKPLSPARRYKRASDRSAALAALIEANAALLIDQGSLVVKRIGATRFWYLRFKSAADEFGHRRDCSVYVGRESDGELVALVQALLDECRQPKRLIAEIVRCAKLASLFRRSLQRATQTFQADANV